MTLYCFSLSSREDGHNVGQAIVCPEARYASVHWIAADHVDRHAAMVPIWQAIDREIAVGLSSDPLPEVSQIAQLLFGPSVRQFLATLSAIDDVTGRNPMQIVRELDHRCWAIEYGVDEHATSRFGN